jgi:hypothetical protein
MHVWYQLFLHQASPTGQCSMVWTSCLYTVSTGREGVCDSLQVDFPKDPDVINGCVFWKSLCAADQSAARSRWRGVTWPAHKFSVLALIVTAVGDVPNVYLMLLHFCRWRTPTETTILRHLWFASFLGYSTDINIVSPCPNSSILHPMCSLQSLAPNGAFFVM